MTKCTICQRTDVDAIDDALRAKRPLRAIGEQFRASTSTLDRHRQHVPTVRRSTKPPVPPRADATPAPSLHAPAARTTEQLISGLEAVVQHQYEQLEHDTSLSVHERSKLQNTALNGLDRLAKLQGRTELTERKILASAAFNRLTEQAKQILMSAAARPCPACGVVDRKWRGETVMELGEGLQRLGEEQGS